jgi:[1-hydroxy-2-(trimethylamino)ethyl]phosphonate dioxygenase
MAAPSDTMADRLLEAFAGSAARLYGGEPVTELAHSLQCAELARDSGADEEFQLACLLHDVGRFAVDPRLIFDKKDRALGARADAKGHHEVGADLIAPYVPERVAWLVRMHADAKRYLCAVEPAYWDTLTAGSRYTLTLQGGVMSAEAVTGLTRHPWLAAAVQLRRWDDLAKVPERPTRPLEAWAPLLRRHFTRPRDT